MIKYFLNITLFIALTSLFSSCDKHRKISKEVFSKEFFQDNDTVLSTEKPEKKTADDNARYKPTPEYPAHRFLTDSYPKASRKIIGKFKNSPAVDTLYFHYYSATYKKHIQNPDTTLSMLSQFYSEEDFYRWIKDVKPVAFATFSDNTIDTLWFSKEEGFPLLEIMYLYNDGDLDGDGLDEISFVNGSYFMSNLSQFRIVSLKQDKWKEIYSAFIMNWMLPPVKKSRENNPFVRKIKDKVFKVPNLNMEVENDSVVIKLP